MFSWIRRAMAALGRRVERAVPVPPEPEPLPLPRAQAPGQAQRSQQPQPRRAVSRARKPRASRGKAARHK
jgi:hypothetical protein